ncbi:MAG: ABC transporter permease [Deinococcales bacterium]
MPEGLRDTFQVARRVLLQTLRDPRFLVLALAVPVLLVLLLKGIFEGVPAFKALHVPIDAYALPAGGFMVFFLAYVLSTLVLVRERRDGTLERMLAVGYGRPAITAGFVAGYGALALVQTALVVLSTAWLFGIDLGSRWVPVSLTTFVLSMVSIAMGVFVSAAARSEGQVFPTIPLLIVPTLLLCGVVLPLEQLPRYLRVLAHVLPPTYAENVLLGMMRKGHDFARELPSFLALAGFGVALTVAASLSVRVRE